MGVLPTMTAAILKAVNLVWFLDGLVCVLEDSNPELEKYEQRFPESTIHSIQHARWKKRQSSLEYLYNVEML